MTEIRKSPLFGYRREPDAILDNIHKSLPRIKPSRAPSSSGPRKNSPRSGKAAAVGAPTPSCMSAGINTAAVTANAVRIRPKPSGGSFPRCPLRCGPSPINRSRTGPARFDERRTPFLRRQIFRMNGGAEGDRTPDLYTASVALSRLSYGPGAAHVAPPPALGKTANA